jgi:hypothetical protein
MAGMMCDTLPMSELPPPAIAIALRREIGTGVSNCCGLPLYTLRYGQRQTPDTHTTAVVRTVPSDFSHCSSQHLRTESHLSSSTVR